MNRQMGCKGLIYAAALTAIGLLTGQQPAQAVLTINIYQAGPDVKVAVSGSLSQLPTASAIGYCDATGALFGAQNAITSFICTGPATVNNWDLYTISGPADFGGGNAGLYPATSVSGQPFYFAPSWHNGTYVYVSKVGLPNANWSGGAYVPGTPFASSATFAGQDLNALGFTTPGLVGIWTLDGTPETIKICVGTGPCGAASAAAAPAPLPLLGAGAGFAYSRRLRRRLNRSLSSRKP